MSLPVPPAGLTAPGRTILSDPVKGQLDKTPLPIVYCNSITDIVIISQMGAPRINHLRAWLRSLG